MVLLSCCYRAAYFGQLEPEHLFAMNHSLSIDGRIKSELEFHAVGAIKGSRTSSIPDSKTDDAHGVTTHGVMIKAQQGARGSSDQGL